MILTGENVQISRSLHLISNKLGIIRNLRRGHSQNSDPKILSYSATTCDNKALCHDGFLHQAGGAGLTWKEAFLATIGEAVERYGSSFYDLNQLKKTTRSNFSEENVIGPEQFSLFHPKQYEQDNFPFVPFTDNTVLYWDKVRDLVDGKEKYCPAIFLYMPFKEDDALISEQISTGFAVHSDQNKAFLSSVFEVVERDAFMITWMNKLPVPKIKISGKLSDLVNRIIPPHFELHLFDMTTDIKIPSVFGILKGKHDFGEFIMVCAATRLNLFEAAKKTVVELCQSIPYLRSLLEEKKDYEDFQNVRSFQDHSLFYIKRKDLWHVFDTWLHKKPQIDIPDKQHTISFLDQINYIVSVFREKGYPLLVKDKTTPDLQQAGFTLMRAVCPNLIHLNGSYGAYYLGGRRLYETPQNMGFDIRHTLETLNHLPHPFP